MPDARTIAMNVAWKLLTLVLTLAIAFILLTVFIPENAWRR